MRLIRRGLAGRTPGVLRLAAALLALAFAASPAGAQPEAPAVSLETHIAWSIRTRCPTAVAVAARLDAYLEGSAEAQPLRAVLSVSERDPERFGVVIELVRGPRTSERAVEGVSCAGVLEASLLVVAIAADPDVAGRAPPSGPSLADSPESSGPEPSQTQAPPPGPEPPGPEPTGPEPTEAEPTGPEPPGPEPPGPEPTGPEPPALEPPEPTEAEPAAALAPDESPRETGLRRARRGEPASSPREAPMLDEPRGGPPEVAFTARAGLALSVDALPEPSLGAAVELGLRVDILEASLGFHWHSEAGRAVNATQGGSFAAYEGLARLAVALRVEWFELAPSLRFGAAAMTGRAYGVSRAIAAVAEWYTLGAGLEARLRWSLSDSTDLAAVLSGDVVGSLTRPEFVILGGDSVYRPPEVSAAFVLGLRLFVR